MLHSGLQEWEQFFFSLEINKYMKNPPNPQKHPQNMDAQKLTATSRGQKEKGSI